MKKSNMKIYNSIRKITAPPTKIFKNKREELLLESIDMDDLDNEFEADIEEALDLTEEKGD